MSIYELRILMHYFAHTDDPPEKRAPIWEETRDRLLAQKMIARNDRTDSDPSGFNPEFKLAERGEAFVRALQRVPLPEPSWKIPAVDLNVPIERPTQNWSYINERI